jgi:hypothetical protein
MNLYQIDQALQQVIDGYYIDELTGEVVGEDALLKALDDKLEGYACYIKNLDADVKALKAEEKALAERRKAKENREESLKKILLGYMQSKGKRKIDTPKACVSLRKSNKVIIDDEDGLIDELKGTGSEALKTSYALNKTVIKKNIEEYAGYAHMEANDNLSIK